MSTRRLRLSIPLSVPEKKCPFLKFENWMPAEPSRFAVTFQTIYLTMKHLKIFSALSLFLLLLVGKSFAQNGNAVISEVQVYSLGDGVGLLEIRVSGNLASTATGGGFTTGAGDRVAVNLLSVSTPSSPGNGSVILSGTFALTPLEESGAGFVELDIQVRAGSMLLTKSKENSSVKTFRY
jgi:hypothetical protein